MIHDSVVAYGPTIIDPDALVGPYCVLGVPADVSAAVPSPASRGVRIGAGCQLLSHVVIGEGSVLGTSVWCDHHTYIGCDTHIGDAAEIMYGARIYDRVRVGMGAWVGGFLCNDAVVEPNAIVLGLIVHKFVDTVEGVPERAPLVQQGAFVGMGAVVVGGVVIETGAYIAAGAVVTENARAGRLYVGIPAREVGVAPAPFASRRRFPREP